VLITDRRATATAKVSAVGRLVAVAAAAGLLFAAIAVPAVAGLGC